MNNPAAHRALGPMSSWPPSSTNHHRWSTSPGAASAAVEWSNRRRDNAVVAGRAHADRYDRQEAPRPSCAESVHRRSTADAVAKDPDAVMIPGPGPYARISATQLVGIPINEDDLPTNIDRKAAAARRCSVSDATGSARLGFQPIAARSDPTYHAWVNARPSDWKFGLYPEEVEGSSPNMDGANASRSGPTSMRTATLNRRPDGRSPRPRLNVRCMRNADGLSGYLTSWPMSA